MEEKIKNLLKIVTKYLKFKKNIENAVNLAINFSIKNSIHPDSLLELSTSYGSNKSYSLAYIFAKTSADLSVEKEKKAHAYFNAGLAAFSIGWEAEAEIQFQLVLKIDPTNVITHSTYGNLLYKMERYEEAEEQYQSALKVDPRNLNTHCNYGSLLQEIGRYKEAEEHYLLALEIDPSDAATLYNYGNLLRNINRYEEAEKQYLLAIKTNTYDVNIHYNYGILLKIMGRNEEAEKQYQLALEIDPKHISSHYNYGNLLCEMRRYEEAEKQYQFALKADPSNVNAYSNYGNLLYVMGNYEGAEKQYHFALKADPTNAIVLSNYGNLLKKINRYEEAEKQYQLVLKTDPNNVIVLLNYGNFLHEMERYEEAEIKYKLVLEVDPNNANAHLNYGLLLEERKCFDKAKKQYQLALEIDPSNVNAHLNYGLLLEEKKCFDKAEKQYQLALEIDPRNVNAHSNYGNLLYYEIKRYEEAEKQYQLALEADPYDVDTHSNYGNLLHEMKRYDEAEKQYQLALEADPYDIDTHFNYGLLLAENGRYEEAEKQYESILEINPKHENTNCNYGILLAETGRKREAEEQYKLALEANPIHVDAHFNYGLLLAESGRYKEAEKQYESILEINPKHADTHSNYGNLLYVMGNYEGAEKQYQLALKFDPNNAATSFFYGKLLYEIGREKEADEQYKKDIKINADDWRGLFFKALILESINSNEEAAKIFDYVTNNKTKVKNEILIEISKFKKNALEKIEQKDTNSGILNKVINAFLGKKEFLFKDIKDNESQFGRFVDAERSFPDDFFSFLSVLRKWNSYTPILPSVENNSKGGGYFLYHCGKGIVIDPGFNFIENFYNEGFKVADIDAVLITHAHSDHTIDFESILTLVHKHNEYIKDHGFDAEFSGKKIDIFMNVGTFMKYSGWLKLKDSDEIDNITVLMPETTYILPPKYHNIKIYTTKAKHDEIIDNKYAIGFILDVDGMKVGFTGDTGWDYEQNGAMSDPFVNYDPRLVIAHIGSIKIKEFEYVDKKNISDQNDCFYRYHLGLLGITKFLQKTNPELTIVSEFGEELRNMRREIIDIISEVLDVKCIPGDIGLHIRLKDLKIYCFIERDFIPFNQIQVSSAPGDKSTLCYHRNQIHYLKGTKPYDETFNDAFSDEKSRKYSSIAKRLKQGAVTRNSDIKSSIKRSRRKAKNKS